MVSIISKLGIQDAPYNPDLNTGTMFDLMTGRFVPGILGCTPLNGGIASTQGVMGKPQVYKTTTIHGLVINAMSRYPHSEFYELDAENSIKDKARMVAMTDFYLDDPIKRALHLEDLDRRVVITNISEHDLESFFDIVKKIADMKLKNPSEFMVETPLIDPRSGKPRMMMIPTFIGVDSWTYAKVKAVMETLDTHGVSDNATLTIHMKNGLAKNKIMTQIPGLASKASIYFVLTAQVAETIEMNAFAPPSKSIQYMKQGEKPKSVGSDFLTLISNLFESRSATVLQTDKQCMYPLPSGITSPTEMSRTNMVVVRCKNNGSGTQFQPVLSQSRGYEPCLTNYNFLRENNYFGMGSNKVNVRTALLPDKVTGRTRIAGDSANYELSRSLEILGQLCYVQKYWSVYDAPVPYDISPEELKDKLDKSGYAMSDILNSRGWWSYGKFDRPMLTLFDILAIVSGKYKPKFLQARAVEEPVMKKAA